MCCGSKEVWLSLGSVGTRGGIDLRTSDLLEVGHVYTREQLAERFTITDKTLYTGVFRPKGHRSIWLFVTEEKSEDMTDYRDHLGGDTLHWQGQKSGVTDRLVIEHLTDDYEIIVFYRPKKTTYRNSGFRYEGRFQYVEHVNGDPAKREPSSFTLRRFASLDPPIALNPPADGADRGSPQGDTLIEALSRLRQAGRDAVIAEGAGTSTQDRMHVQDGIEDWVANRIEEWRSGGREKPLLVVLSGNAGDGKSDLIERLRRRPGIVSDDTDVIADATHADSPSQSQAERLVKKLSLFRTEPLELTGSARCVLVAMNVGMVIAFFDALHGTKEGDDFGSLADVLRYRLGLNAHAATPPAHWQCEVVNLDNRNLLGRENDGIFSGMLARLDPEVPGSLTHDAAKGCHSCSARPVCWVRTNLNILRLPSVKQSLHELLWEVTLGEDLHLSPRNLWDFLFQVTTGGMQVSSEPNEAEFLSCAWIRESFPGTPQEFSKDEFRFVQRRLLYNSVFEQPLVDMPSRGAILYALTKVDPIRRGGKQTHLLEGEVTASPRVDSDHNGSLALQADEPGPDSTRQMDPLLSGLASLTATAGPDIWQADAGESLRSLALSVSRRARLTAIPAEVYEELLDLETSQFLDLLLDYATWRTGSTPPATVEAFWRSTLVAGVSQIFGVDLHTQHYFRLDTLSPSTRFAAYVPVDLEDAISVIPDTVSNGEASWLEAVAYIPRRIIATVRTGGALPWEIPVDLQLFRLLNDVNRGYVASSVDLETFFRLRYACERLGATDSGGQILFKSLQDGSFSRLEQRRQLDGTWKTVFSLVDTK